MSTAPVLTETYDRPVAHPTLPTNIDLTLSAVANSQFPAMFSIMIQNHDYAHHDIVVVGDETFQFVDPTILNKVSNDLYIAVYLQISATQRVQAFYLACAISGLSQSWPLGTLPLLSGGVGNAKVASSHALVVYCESIDIGGGSTFVSIINCFNGVYSGAPQGNPQHVLLGGSGIGQPNNFLGGSDQIPTPLTGNHGAVFFPSESPDNFGAGVTINGIQTVPLEWVDGTFPVTIYADADERTPQQLTGPLFRTELTPNIDAGGVMTLQVHGVPIHGDGTDAPEPGPTTIFVPHDQSADGWQDQKGRPRQDFAGQDLDDLWFYTGRAI